MPPKMRQKKVLPRSAGGASGLPGNVNDLRTYTLRRCAGSWWSGTSLTGWTVLQYDVLASSGPFCHYSSLSGLE